MSALKKWLAKWSGKLDPSEMQILERYMNAEKAWDESYEKVKAIKNLVSPSAKDPYGLQKARRDVDWLYGPELDALHRHRGQVSEETLKQLGHHNWYNNPAKRELEMALGEVARARSQGKKQWWEE